MPGAQAVESCLHTRTGVSCMKIDDWLARWSPNYAFLREAVVETARSLARRDYAAFLQPGEEFSFAQFVGGVHIDFEVDVFRIDRADGSLWVRVQARSRLATPLGLKPAAVIRKLPDGRAFLMR
jgi:hypothetical protein